MLCRASELCVMFISAIQRGMTCTSNLWWESCHLQIYCVGPNVMNMYILLGLMGVHVYCAGPHVMYMFIVLGLSGIHVHCAGPHGCTC